MGGVIASLDQVHNLAVTDVHRPVAVGYWDNVARIGQEAAAWGEAALRHLADNDLKAAEAAVYAACDLERPLAHRSMTWKPVHALVRRVAFPGS